MTSNQKLDKLLERVSKVEARLDLIDQHLKNNLEQLTTKVNAGERQLYAMYVVGGVHLMLMGFVLKKIFG